jgi:hypothetical protein
MQFTTILAMRFLSTSIMVFKTRSLELHPLSLALGESVEHPPLRNAFPDCTFREVQISDPIYQTHSQDAKTISLKVLAYDVMLGLFLFDVFVDIPTRTSRLVPSLDVRLVGVYSVGGRLEILPVSATQNTAPPGSPRRGELGDGRDTPTPEGVYPSRSIFDQYSHVRFHHTSSLPNPYMPGRSTGSTVFVAAHSLGSQGLRAVWIQRSRLTMTWDVVGCKLPLRLHKPEVRTAEELDAKVVSSTRSYDLRGTSHLTLIYCSSL